MERDEPPLVGERLDHREAPRNRFLGDELLPAEAQSPRRLPQFRFRPRAPHARTRGAHRLLEKNRITFDFCNVFFALEDNCSRLRHADFGKRLAGGDLVLDREERVEVRDHGPYGQRALQRRDRLLLGREEHVDGAVAADSCRGLQPGERLRAEAGDFMNFPHMFGEPGEADPRRRKDLDPMAELAEARRDLS